MLELNNNKYYLELKHILIGKEPNQSPNLDSYFSQGYTIQNDINKLNKVTLQGTAQRFQCTFISGVKYNTKQELCDEISKVLRDRKLARKTSLLTCDYDKIAEFGYFFLEVMVGAS